jgi:hypothetical protein
VSTHRAVAGAVLALLAGAVPAGADTVTVNLRDASGGAPLAATAAAVSLDGHFAGAATASGTGQATITGLDPAGTYTVTANLPGYAVARRSGLAAGTTSTLDLTRSANRFVAVPVFGGANGGLYADGQPGVFYAQSTQIPQLYRTMDWGGTWSPISVAADDPVEGLAGSSNIGHDISVATSGFPGEIAAFVAGSIYASHDFGISWKKVAGAPAPASPSNIFPRLLWGHAGNTSVLVETLNDHQYLADMTAATPTFAQMTTDYARAADNQAFAVANGKDGPYVAVADSAGDVNVYALSAAPAPGAAVLSRAGFLTAGPPKFVSFGGKAPDTGPPSGIAVASASEAGMSVKATADPGYPVPVRAAAPSCIGIEPGPYGTLTPDSGTTAGTGVATMNNCWLSLSGGTLTVTSGVQVVIDAGWGQSFGGNVSNVTFGRSTRGPVKSAALSAGVPAFDATATAAAGTAAGSGGVSVNGITAPTVEGQTFGPSAPGQQATVLHGGFGGVGYASSDGGQSVKVASGLGGWSVDWFAGASGSWLVFGTPSNSTHALTAFKDWTTATPEAATSNVSGAQANDNTLLLDGTPMTTSETFATALAGAPGTDLLFVGLSDSNGFDANADGVVRRLRLSDGPTASEVTAIGSGQIAKAVHALAYCPTGGSADAVKDVLLVATGVNGGGGGGLWRVTGATGGAPVVTQVASVPAAAFVYDVKAHCASGTVWAGTDGFGKTLYKSTDGGQAFTAQTLPHQGPSQAIGISQADAKTVLVGMGIEGYVLGSADGGATWTVQNNPATEHNFSGDGIADLLVPPPTTAARAIASGARFSPRAFSGLSGGDMLLAGAGVYSARLKTATVVAPPPPAADKIPPFLGALTMTARRFAVIPKATAISAKRHAHRGTAFKFILSEKATASIGIQRGKQGWKKGKKCVAKKPKVSKPVAHKGKKPKPAPKAKRCIRGYVAIGTLVRKDLAGSAVVKFTGQLGTLKLSPGGYRARLTARDAAGNVSKAKLLTFTVVKK